MIISFRYAIIHCTITDEATATTAIINAVMFSWGHHYTYSFHYAIVYLDSFDYLRLLDSEIGTKRHAVSFMPLAEFRRFHSHWLFVEMPD